MGGQENCRPASSWIREASPYGETMEPCVDMNPETAKEKGIKQWDWVWVESTIMRLKFRAVIAPWIDKRTVSISMGWRNYQNRQIPRQLFMDKHPELRSALLRDTRITNPGYGSTGFNVYKVKEGE
jgi:anaerobic selenocysteine-containing dehydrogenase